MTPRTMNPPDFKSRLLSVLTDYDRRQSARAGYNPRALGIYFARADDICADIAAGTEPRAAICAGLSGRLLDFVLKRMGLPVSTSAECRGDTSWHYSPVSSR